MSCGQIHALTRIDRDPLGCSTLCWGSIDLLVLGGLARGQRPLDEVREPLQEDNGPGPSLAYQELLRGEVQHVGGR